MNFVWREILLQDVFISFISFFFISTGCPSTAHFLKFFCFSFFWELLFLVNGHSTLVGQQYPMKPLLSVYSSVCPSLIKLFVFSDIAYDDNLPDNYWLTKQDLKKKKIWQPQFGSKLGTKLSFLPFSHIWFISFPWNCIKW